VTQLRLFLITTIVWTFGILNPFSDLSAQTPPLPLPGNRVVDLAGVLGAGQGGIPQKIAQLQIDKGAELAVLVVPSLENTAGGETLEQFGIRLAEYWKLGRPGIDDGAILIVALAERQVRIEVGRGLEGDLPDVIVKRIIEEQILPRFRGGDLAAGVAAGVDSMIAVVQKSELPPPHQEGKDNSLLLVLVVFLFAVGNVLAMLFGSFPGAVGTGVLGFGGGLMLASFPMALGVGFLMWFLVLFREPLIQILLSSGGSSGYGGYRGSGGSSGGFGSGGVFSGGGASGRW
jgi:uncharacterized protein